MNSQEAAVKITCLNANPKILFQLLLSSKQLKAEANGQHGIKEWSSRKWPIPGPFGPSLLGLGPGPPTFNVSI